MESRSKRFCRHCGVRIRHATRRCPRCQKLTPTWKVYLAVGLAVIMLGLLLSKYLGVF